MPTLTAWEYKSWPFVRYMDQNTGVFHDAIDSFDFVANTLGAQGWEIVTILPTVAGFAAFFKRPSSQPEPTVAAEVAP